MSVAASVALAVAQRVERTGGPRAGLVAWKTLAGNATDGEVRGKAVLAALRCALALRDTSALAELTEQWTSVEGGVWDEAIASSCEALVRAGLLPCALELARAEALRHRTARSLYGFARCLDVARDASAAAVFREAIARAEREGAREIELASRARRAAILARSWRTMSEALEEALRVEPAEVPPEARLAVLRVRLRSSSRFVRAAALGALDELVLADDEPHATRALTLAARWADDVGDTLTPLEADRLVALLGRARVVRVSPRAQDVARSLARLAASKDDASLAGALDDAARRDPELLPLHARARDILGGRFEAAPLEPTPPPPAGTAARRAFRWSEMLDVVVAMRDRAPARAARTLRALADAMEAGERLPPQVLGVAQVALAYDDAELRDAAARLIRARLERVAGGAPPCGYAALADTLARVGMAELAAVARRAAVIANEPGASESLGTSLAREGWALAKAGERAQAIDKLREAKAIFMGHIGRPAAR